MHQTFPLDKFEGSDFKYDNSFLKMLPKTLNYHFHDGGSYHIETSPLICRANQWTDFYMITASVVKELRNFLTQI